MSYKLAIFDMDGTILNTLDDLADALNYALKKNDYPERTLNEVRQFVGNGIRKLIERGVPISTDISHIDRVHEDFTEFYKVHCTDKTKAYDGVHELLIELRKNGVKTAVVSNKADYAVQELCRRYFDGLFDAAAGEQPSIRKKPFPDSVITVMQKLGVNCADTVYIGDSDVDIETARNAGTDCISVDWGFRDDDVLRKNGAAVIVSDAAAVAKLIL